MYFRLHAALALAPALFPTARVDLDTIPALKAPHAMVMVGLGKAWHFMGMAQVLPIRTGGSVFHDAAPLDAQALYLTQPAVMVNLASPGARIVLRTTLNFEAWSQPDGELTYGGWGEGFIDKRHPHTLLHEAMLTYNAWQAPGRGSFSLSAGKGFAPYGTDDPMSRPVAKFPTNHHLSQVLERYTINALYLTRTGLSLEAGLFSGGEPDGPYDFSNIESFGNSFSVRAIQRLGSGSGPAAAWEVSGSYARVKEVHHESPTVTHLLNAAVRHHQRHRAADVYALLEASQSEVAGPTAGYRALVGEMQLGLGKARRHQPYLRVEWSTRPEYQRDGLPGTEGFYRYDHDHAEMLGASEWLIPTVGYGAELGRFPITVAPFLEVQYNHVRQARGAVDPKSLFGRADFWSATAGFRLQLGGARMRMGSYGALDPMTAAMRPTTAATTDAMAHHAPHP